MPNLTVGMMLMKQNMHVRYDKFKVKIEKIICPSHYQEKKRVMLRLEPPGHENAIIDNYVPIYRPGEFKVRKTEDLDLSKIL